jgi:hypothetical protein
VFFPMEAATALPEDGVEAALEDIGAGEQNES